MDKKYLLRIAGYIALALAAVILTVDVAYQLAASAVDSVDTLPVASVTQELSIEADGYIVRDEAPLEYTSDGLLTYSVSDGTRVTAGTKVAEIYGGDEGQSEKLDQLYDVMARRQLLEEAFAKKGSYSSGAVDREIGRLKGKIDALTAEGSTVGLSALTDSLQTMLYIRELKGGNDLSGVAATLDAEIASLKEAVGGALASVKSDRTGYYFSSCDGYESYLSVDDLNTAEPDQLRAILHRKVKPNEVSGNAGKIVTDYTWCVVVELPFSSAKDLSEGKTYSVGFTESGEQQIEMQLTRLTVEYGSDTALAVFTCTEMPDGFTYTRYQTVTIVLGEADGYRIPVGALRQQNGITGVYVLRGSVVEFREISPILLHNGSVLVDSSAEPTGDYPMLNYYDVIIIRGKELYVGKIVDQ